ncbi:MAG: hypothetical protein A3J27_07285 [Candidatus Tectomicrobia bacterium RIFCSPLOWO2_12_FULL_69_37]|nr:MAG: hypothetical protein A3J27_07285 [Candidatus Tectomicrobia bacterium RIFCSPLOWO2_12_FULL_69_37]
MGWSPRRARATTAAETEARTMEPSTRAFRSPTSSSRVKVTAAMGVLKAAARPAAAPTGTSAWTRSRRMENIRPMELASPPQIWTVGPSRPRLEPEPMFRAPMTNLPSHVRTGM